MIEDTTSKYDDFVYRWQRGGLGGFEELLAKTIAKADLGNRKRLAKAFPGEVNAINRFNFEDGYWDNVIKTQEKMRNGYI